MLFRSADPPPRRVDEFAAVVGRRGGKDRSTSVLATYIAALCDHSDALVPGERPVLLCIAPDQRQAAVQLNYIEIGKNEGAKLLTGGKHLSDGAYGKGWFHEPTVFGDCSPSMRIAQEEIFGPVVSVIPIHSFEEAIEVANDVPYGLSASIYTRDVNRAFQATRDLYTGIVYVNAPTIGAETHLPFGGTKQTGNGHREAAIAAIDFFTEWKTVYIDYSDKLQRAQIDNV